MKRFFLAILAFLYITASTGATLHIHYCMGKMIVWELGHNDSKYCSNCGMEESDQKDKGCCKDENKFVKSNTDQKTAQAGFQFIQLSSTTLPVSFIEIPLSYFPYVTDLKAVSHAPSRNAGVAVYIRNCIFRI